MKRFFDLSLALFIMPIITVPMVLIALVIKVNSKGPILYWSDRVGIKKAIYRMPKFRTMKIETPSVATHLLLNQY